MDVHIISEFLTVNSIKSLIAILFLIYAGYKLASAIWKKNRRAIIFLVIAILLVFIIRALNLDLVSLPLFLAAIFCLFNGKRILCKPIIPKQIIQ